MKYLIEKLRVPFLTLVYPYWYIFSYLWRLKKPKRTREEFFNQYYQEGYNTKYGNAKKELKAALKMLRTIEDYPHNYRNETREMVIKSIAKNYRIWRDDFIDRA